MMEFALLEKSVDIIISFFRTTNLWHKTGLPHIVKINKAGKLVKEERLSKIMWAVDQEVELMQLK